jgi:GntR family transcriptional regulator / MocR family aminotransferase
MAAPHDAIEFDFRPGEPDVSHFPRQAWGRAARRAMQTLAPRHLGYGSAQGALELRLALVDYLARVRGVAGSAHQMIICNGAAQALSIAARALGERGVQRMAVEDPGHPDIRRIVTDAGLVPVPVPVDGDGLNVGLLERANVQAVLVSPAHQNPIGGVLSPERRQHLLAWASSASAHIVEDDYDAEYRYDRAAVGALQGVAPERVIYIGSASKILAPALRLGWLLMNEPLVASGIDLKRRADNGSPVIEQLTYASFVATGELDRHLRRMRRLYQSRRVALLDALSTHCPDWTVLGAAAGLHLVAIPPTHVDIAGVVQRAAEHSVRLYPLSDYAPDDPTRRGLIFGYARLLERDIAEAVRRIASAEPVLPSASTNASPGRG